VPSIDWLPWHTAAFLEAQRRRRPVLLLLETAWSPACARAHDEVFSRADVVSAVADGMVPVRVDADLRPDIGDRYGLGHWPSLLVLTPEGLVLTGGTHLQEGLAARIRDAARVFAAHVGPWPSALVSPPSDPADLDDDAAVLDAFALAIRATRDATTGACLEDGRPSAAAALFALAHATARGDADWASTGAATIDALPHAVPRLDDTGVVAFGIDAARPATPARLEDQAEWIRVLARAVRLEPLPDWTLQLDRLVQGLRSGFRRDDGHWRPWTGSPRLVFVDASARACRALLAAADALDRPDLAREAIDALEVLAPLAYSRGAGVSHVIADGHARGPVLLDDAMLLAHALLDADAWRGDPVYRDLAEELVRTSLARLQEPSGAIRDRVAALAGAGQVGRLADPHHPITGNAAAARLLGRLFPDDDESAAAARRILRAVTPEAIAAGSFGAPVGLAWHALGPAGPGIAAW
jgi:hypothetical protein